MLGELLANDTSRRIIEIISDRELYLARITNPLHIRVSLGLHHVKKLETLEMVTVTHKKLYRWSKNHKHYKMKPEFHIVELRKIVDKNSNPC